MATLEKIRSRSVLLLVIIGLALLAFIVGDFFTSGRTLFGTGSTVAEVDGQKIDIQEFQRRVSEASQQAQQSGRKMDPAVLQQQVLNGMIAEALFKQEVEKLGLKVTDDELSQAMLGAGAPYLDRMVQQQTGIESATALHDMAFNPAKYGIDENQAAQLQNYWIGLEKQMEESLLQQKFQNLFMGTLVANELDARALYDENATTSQIVFAKSDFSAEADDKYPVSDEEIEAQWKKERNRFALNEPMRHIGYINVPIEPSQADRQAAQARVEKAVAALNEKPGTDGIDGMTEFIANRTKTTLGKVSDKAVKNFLSSDSAGRAAVISFTDDVYTIGKVLGRDVEVDSLNLDMLAVQGTRAEVDSLVRGLNAGTLKFDDLAKAENVQGSQDSLWVSLIDPQVAQMKSTLLDAAAGVYFTPDTAANLQGARIFRVNSRKAPVTVYDVALINYTVEPGAATVNNLLTNLQKFLGENTTAADFAANAEKAGYMASKANITPSTPLIGNVEGSRAALSWALDAKKGSVSPVFGDESTGSFMAVAVNDIYNGEYAPATDPSIRELLTTQVRNDKKAKALIERYKGKAKDVNGYAKLMGTQADTTNVAFGQYMIPKLGIGESAIAGRASVAKPGQLVGPMQGNSGVVVFYVVKNDSEGRPYNFDESAMMYQRSRGAQALGNQLNSILQGREKVENNLIKFYPN